MNGAIAEITGSNAWQAAVILGSGLSELGRDLTATEPIPYSAVTGMPVSGVAGHEGSLYAGSVSGNDVLVFAGRVHLYEGHSPAVVTTPVRLAVEAGCEVIVLTNAAGGIAARLEVGTPCLISDHLNLTGQNPLTGPHDARGPRFLDLTEVYDKELRRRALEVDPTLQEGIYAGLAGPTYETPAEVRMLRAMGADLVGMSTVHEAIMARYLGAKVLGLSVVTNQAAGISPRPLAHEEVAEAGRRAATRLEELLREVCRAL
jgi:purine-nucleoside phosphorylase